MMLALRILLLGVLLCSGSVFGACILNKEFEETIPFSLMGIIVYLYLFYIFDILLIGYYSLIAIMVILYIVSIYHIIKKKDFKEYLKKFFTPGLMIFSITLIIYRLLTNGLYVELYDELRLWAAVPKALFATSELQLGKKSYIYSWVQYYPPGIALLQYFWSKTLGIFIESHLFLVKCMLVSSLFMPMLKNIQKKQLTLIPVIVIVIIILPLSFYGITADDFSYYYRTLFIDPVLGMFFAFGLYLAYNKPFENWYKIITFSVFLSTFVLLKNSGMFFVIGVISASVILKIIDEMKRSKIKKIKNRKKLLNKFIKIFICILIPVLTYYSWELTYSAYKITNVVADPVSFGSIKALIFSQTAEQHKFNKLFFYALGNKSLIYLKLIYNNSKLLPLIGYLNPSIYTYKGSMIIITIITVGLAFVLPKTSRKKYYVIQAILYIWNFIFVLSLYVLYYFSLGPKFPSFCRYISTILIAHITILIMIFLSEYFNVDLQLKGRKELWGTIVLALAITLIPLYQLDIGNDGTYQIHEWALGNEDKIKTSINTHTPKNIFLVMNGNVYNDAMAHHQLYFDLIDDNIIIKNYYTDTNVIPNSTDPKVLKNSVKNFEHTLIKENYSYIYITCQSEIFTQYFGKLFDGPIKLETLYKVNVNHGNVKLVPIK